MNLRRFFPWPADRIEVVLFGLLLMASVVWLTGCSGVGFLPPTSDEVAEVVADTRDSADRGNRVAIAINAFASLALILLGKRALKRYDDDPYTPEDVASLERAKKIAAIDGEPKA